MMTKVLLEQEDIERCIKNNLRGLRNSEINFVVNYDEDTTKFILKAEVVCYENQIIEY